MGRKIMGLVSRTNTWEDASSASKMLTGTRVFSRALRGAVIAGAAAWSVACGAPSVPDEELDFKEDAIVGGRIETGYPSVGYTRCTASLIAPSVILSAAHCGPKTWIKFGNDLLHEPYAQYSIDATVSHPTGDLLVSHLSQPVTDRPVMEINRGALPNIGASLTAVGFGGTDLNGTGSGIKRSATVILDQIINNSDPRVLVRWGDGRTRPGDSGGPLIGDGKILGIDTSGSDCASPTCGRTSYTQVNPAWIDANMGVAPPTPFGSLYMVATDTGTFYRASKLGVKEQLEGVPGTVSMVGLNGALWSLRNDQLTKWDPVTGETTSHGAGWGGPTLMTKLRGSLYAIQAGLLWKIDDPEAGTYHQVGGDNWTGATSMVGADKGNDNTLVIISDALLFKVNPDTGERTEWVHDWWGGPTFMATLTSSALTSTPRTAVYVHQDDNIWVLDGLGATTYTHLGDRDFAEATALVGVDGGFNQPKNLYFPKNGRLYRVDRAGNWEILGREQWNGAMVMTAL